MFWKIVFSASLLLTLSVLYPNKIYAEIPGYTKTGPTFGNAYDNEIQIYSLVNRERSRSRIGKLAWDDVLAEVARSYSRKMAREGFLDHFDREGRTVVDRAESAKIKGWERIGENLFFCDPIDRLSHFALQGWMRSATHRENILDDRWSATGVGVAIDRNGGIYITQIFVER